MERGFLIGVVLVLAMAVAIGGTSAGAAPPSDPAAAASKAKKKKKKKKKQQPVANHPYDADGDGLPYAWEAKPATQSKAKKKKKKKRKKAGKSAVAPELWRLGADPNRKDIFLQLDFATAAGRANLPCGDLDQLVTTFANGAVGNPDGSNGINLHIDAGKVCPSRSYDLGASKLIPGTGGDPCPGFSTVLNFDQLPDNRVGSWHLAGIVGGSSCGNGEHGVATSPGVSMVVYSDGPGIAHVLMHELGHNLGLQHNEGFRPNRISVMNTRVYTTDNGNAPVETPDYQRFSIPALDETALDESTGLGTPAVHRNLLFWVCPPGEGGGFVNTWPADGPVDWNCNGDGFTPVIDPSPISSDINGDGQLTTLPATSNEWVQLDLPSGGKIGKLVP